MDEAPNCLTLSIEATGLPNVPSMIEMFSTQMAHSPGGK
jgi:hypothetical protein